MTEHDLALLERLRNEPSSDVVDADDPPAVAAALVGAGGRSLAPEDVAGWVAEAQLLRSRAEAVLAAEQVVAGAVAFERSRRLALVSRAPAGDEATSAPAPTGDPVDEDDDGPDADRAAVRFSLVVLAVAQVGGIAVYAADGMLLAAAVPALAIVGVLAVALAHRRPPPVRYPEDDRIRSIPVERTVEVAPDPRAEEESSGSPAVRAAEAHLRRQLAAWKVAWWDRELPPADVGTWLGGPPSTTPATLVVTDPERRVDADLYAAMTAALPAAVRVVLVRARAG